MSSPLLLSLTVITVISDTKGNIASCCINISLFFSAIGQVLIERKAEYLKPNGRLNMSKFNGILDNSEMEIQFLGLVALQNPIRLSVPEAIFKCRRAGVKVIMVTFDHPATALSIAETAGIVLHRRATCLDMEGADETLRLVVKS